MNLARRAARVAMAALCLCAAGCAGGVFDKLSPWRRADVLSVVAATAIPDGTDLLCAGAGGGPVAIVRLRVGRAPYVEAFALPAASTLMAGDRVRVRSDPCAIEGRTKAVD